jgi:type IV pilus assembly protein PilC
MPIISPIIKKINLARFSRIVSTLMKTDIMIVKTFSIAANTLGNLHYREVASEMSERLKKGNQLNEVILARPDLFPPSIAQMVMVGEKTGELDNVLSELAEFYEMEVHQTMDSLPSIIEPLLILILGVLVGGIAIAIMLPYYSLISSI